MGKSAIADTRTGYRRKPPVEHRELGCQGCEYWQLLWREVIHDVLGMVHIPPLLEVALDKTLHVGDARATVVFVEYL